jgi:hypothetical protein
MTTAASAYRNNSIDLTGASQQVFADVGYQGIEERFIANPNAANPVWINALGGAAVVNGKGSFLLAAGGYWATKHTGVVNVIGTNGDKLTAGER